MKHKDCLISLLVAPWLLTSPITLQARNCTKGKPCGNGCIAQNKTCRIESGDSQNRDPNDQAQPTTRSPSVLIRSQQRLPKVYVVTAQSLQAREVPSGQKITGHYKFGQSVFVYQTHGSWARLSNMQPEEWVELKHLRLK
ncbi:MAG: hypothetical protein P8179_13710 [Candidatus Thiodiazotropha sp.]|jgi:hypothetical protein